MTESQWSASEPTTVDAEPASAPERLAAVRGLRAAAAGLIAVGDYESGLDLARRAYTDSTEALTALRETQDPGQLPWQMEQLAAVTEVIAAQAALGDIEGIADGVRELGELVDDVDPQPVAFAFGVCRHGRFSARAPGCMAKPPCQ